MRDEIRHALEKRRTLLEHRRQHRRKRCAVAGCLVCAAIEKRAARQERYCTCGDCSFCKERRKIVRAYNERYGAEMAWYYRELRVAPSNSFKAIDHAYHYCHSLDD